MGVVKTAEHKFKALFFWLLKVFLRKGNPNLIPLDASQIGKILVLRPDKLGDIIISLPVFDSLKKHFPHIQISLLASNRNKVVVENDTRFQKIYLYQKKPSADIKTIRQLRKEKFDCVIDLVCQDSVTLLFLTQIITPRKPRIGLNKTQFAKYYDYNDPLNPNETTQITDKTLRVLNAFGIDSRNESGFAKPFLTDYELVFGKQTISSLRDSDETKIIGYNLSAGAPNRVWAIEKSIGLLKSIYSLYPKYKILLFTAPDERVKAEEVHRAIPDNSSIIPENLNLMSVTALIKYLDLLITPDTSLVHIARSFEIPVIGLYSNNMKNYNLWRPYKQDIGAINSNDNDNIYDITVEQVLSMLKKMIEQGKLVTS